MQTVTCDCGRVMYPTSTRCPSCGRSIWMAVAKGDPIPKREDHCGPTHRLGCACHEARRDAALAGLRALLRKLEWASHCASYGNSCPSCGGDMPSELYPNEGGHEPDCELVAALREVA